MAAPYSEFVGGNTGIFLYYTFDFLVSNTLLTPGCSAPAVWFLQSLIIIWDKEEECQNGVMADIDLSEELQL